MPDEDEPAPEPDDCAEGPRTGPCQPYLAVADLVCGCDGIDVNDPATAAIFTRMIDHAGRRFYTATDGKYPGCCTAKIRPCRRQCSTAMRRAFERDPSVGAGWVPAYPLQLGPGPTPTFVNCWACSCGQDDCACGHLEAIRLPWLPVRDVLEVKIDGDVLDEGSYRLLPGSNTLVRLDGYWPRHQNQALEDTEVGTWSVTEQFGLPAPADAIDLIAGFACALTKRCLGKPCGLPDGVRVVQRPGITYAVIDPQKYREQGLTGYSPLDDWLMADRGGHTRVRPRMWTQFDQPTAMRG